MSDAYYVIKLGNGFYMDSNGEIRSEPLENAPSIPTSGGGLPISPAAAQKALENVSKALKFDDVTLRQRMISFGVPAELISVLQNVSKLAGTLAKAVPYVGAVIAVAEMMGFLKGGKDPILDAIKKLTDHTTSLFKLVDDKWTGIDVQEKRDIITTGVDTADSIVNGTINLTVNPAVLKDRLVELQSSHTDVVNALKYLMQPLLWQSIVAPSTDDDDDDGPTHWWPTNLYYPQRNAEPTQQNLAVFPAPAELRFDHRAMAVVVTGMTQAYLSLIKTLLPEYRSIGEYKSHLSELARKVEELTKTMGTQNLVRTHYTKYDFTYFYPRTYIASDLSIRLEPWLGGYHVGAVDICANVEVPPLPAGFGWRMDQTGAKVDIGAIHFNWTPPAKLAEENYWGTIRYRVENPDECAAAANTQAEQDYALILVSSGYMHLAQTAALLRHLYTEPIVSETVVGQAFSHYMQGEGKAVTVTGKPAFPLDPVTAQAMRYAQSCKAEIRFTTQPADRLSLLNYRILLRTAPVGVDGTSDYGSMYHARYQDEPIPHEPGTELFQKLVCEYNGGAVGEVPLALGTTPPEPLVEPGKLATIKADTFDWWVPVPDAAVQGQVPTQYLNELRSLGWSPTPEHTQPAGGGAGAGFGPSSVEARAAIANVSEVRARPADTDLLRASTPQPLGQRRDKERTDIKVRYSMEWDGIDVVVTIETVSKVEDDPSYRFRNADLFLVVEETLGSGQVLHTAFPVPLTGQITYVPESFFEKERAAIDQSNSWWRELIREYSESTEISPIDPIAQVTDRMISAPGGIERLAEVVRATQPQFLAQYLRDHPPQARRPNRR